MKRSQLKIITLFSVLLFSACLLSAKTMVEIKKELTAKQVVELIKQKVNCEWADKTVDTFKAGNPDDQVTGIAVCMFADMKMLKQAVQNNCNFIIAHEPTFYNHLDETEFFKDDQVYQDKMKYINKHKLIIWRFHDHIHMMKPDGIYEGMISELGWESNKVNDSSIYFEFKPQKLNDFVNQLADKFETKGIRIVGDPEMEFTKVALRVGASGSKKQILTLRDQNTEVLVAGEVPEWETYEYVHDAVEQGKNKAVLFIGHIHSEEAGMKYCASWLKSFVELPIKYFKNGQAYWSPLSK